MIEATLALGAALIEASSGNIGSYSGGFSRERVLAVYATIVSRYAEILAGRSASILSSVFRSRGTGTFYQIRVGADTFEIADNLCGGIRRAGGACIVLRNGR